MRARTERLIELLAQFDVDMMLVTDRINVRYLTGYTGSNGLVLVGPRTRSFITDFRYVEQAEAQVHPAFERRRAPRELIEAVAEALPIDPLRLGFEDAHVTVREHARLRELLPDRIELVPAGSPVEALRLVKGSEEIEAMRASARLADEAFEQVVAAGLAGRTEHEVAVALEQAMRERGARGPSFDTIVASGAHGALPHASPRDVEIERGELVTIDWGAQLDGYCSDCTRTLGVGEVDRDRREVYELVLAAQQAGLEAVSAGASGRAVDSAARELIAAAGYGERFGHGLGHGVGLNIHEGPRLSQRSSDELAAGNAVTVEPGIYLPGRFGIRIEDLVIVTASGCEILSSIPKQLMVTD